MKGSSSTASPRRFLSTFYSILVTPALLIIFLSVPALPQASGPIASGADIAFHSSQSPDYQPLVHIYFSNIFLSRTATVSGTVEDPEGIVVRVEVRVDDLPWETATEIANWHYQFDTTVLPDGRYSIVARCCRAEKCFGYGGTIFVIDNTAPRLSITSPSEGGTVTSSRVEVTWTADDVTSDIDHVEVSMDAGASTVLELGIFRYAFTEVDDGFHTVVVTAFDFANNSKTASVGFNVDTDLLSPTGPIGTVGFITTGVAVSVAVIGLAIAMIKARKRRQQPPT